jgi:hypothetical protein
MPSVSVSLDKISSPGSGSGSDHRALLATDQCAAHGPGNAADNGSSSSAMVSASLGEALADEDSK